MGARRQGDAGALEQHGHGGSGVGAHEPVGAATADAHLGETVEVAQEVLPFRNEAALAQGSSRCFCIASTRNEQKTWPRMAASEEWKIGRVRMIALVRRKRSSTWSRSR